MNRQTGDLCKIDEIVRKEENQNIEEEGYYENSYQHRIYI